MTNRIAGCIAAAILSCPGLGAQNIVVRPGEVLGEVKPMNAVNNGPIKAPSSQAKGNFDAYSALEIPFMRNHDAALSSSYGGCHTVDVTAVFPDFDADENDPASYDFTLTDRCVALSFEAGAEVFYRLGQSIENATKKYNVFPPKDYAKWARICEHIILHYNEGWADGFRYGIRYWEIWNEPDMHWRNPEKSPTWQGTEAQFQDFFATAAKHLKKRFPHLRIGGPAICENEDWGERFISQMHRRRVPLDFLSWHGYSDDPTFIADRHRRYRAMLDANGYSATESICNEWNYIENWTTRYTRSLEEVSGCKGAAFVAAVMQESQAAGMDMLIYYDFRPATALNGVFDFATMEPLPTYYTYYCWKKLRSAGTLVRAESDDPTIRVTAARDAEGGVGLMISRFCGDNNDVAAKIVTISLEGEDLPDCLAYITDARRRFTETPVRSAGGKLSLKVNPNSVIYIRLK